MAESKYKYLASVLENIEGMEIYLDDEELEEIIHASIREHKKTANKGLKQERLQHNPRELAFANEWEKVNDPLPWLNYGNGVLQDLFINVTAQHKSGPVLKISDHERMIVATVIQWLGSNIGMSFLGDALKNCGYKIVPIKD